MTRSAVRFVLPVALFLSLALSPNASAADFEAGKAFTKLLRGAVNVITGWVEIPKRILETSETSGAVTGFTWGTLRGLGHGFIRTAAGAYEIATFPFPAPAGYLSIMDPEYVFSEDTASEDPYAY